MPKPKAPTFIRFKRQALRSAALRKALDTPDEDPFLEVAYRLIELRREQGLSQAGLARKLGVSQQSLARLESPNYKGHSLRTLSRIARACGKKLQIRFLDEEAP